MQHKSATSGEDSEQQNSRSREEQSAVVEGLKREVKEKERELGEMEGKYGREMREIRERMGEENRLRVQEVEEEARRHRDRLQGEVHIHSRRCVEAENEVRARN